MRTDRTYGQDDHQDASIEEFAMPLASRAHITIKVAILAAFSAAMIAASPALGQSPAASPAASPAVGASAAPCPSPAVPVPAGSPAASPVASPAAAESAAAAAAAAAVTIMNFSFQPATITVPVCGTVTWTNQDTTGHTVTADDGSFDSGTIAPGSTFSQTFTTAGTFAYHCSIHPTMTGTVTVQ
jgi:plastocyanin